MPKRSQTDVKRLQQKAQELFDQGYGKAEVAKLLNVSARTLQRWEKSKIGMDTYTFQRLEKIVQEIPNIDPQENTTSSLDLYTPSPQSTLKMIQDLMPKAINVITNILDSPATSNRDKLKAAQLSAEWSGYAKGRSFALDLAIEHVCSYGYTVTEP